MAQNLQKEKADLLKRERGLMEKMINFNDQFQNEKENILNSESEKDSSTMLKKYMMRRGSGESFVS